MSVTVLSVMFGYRGGGVELPRPFAAAPIPSLKLYSFHPSEHAWVASIQPIGTSVISDAVPPWNVPLSSFVGVLSSRFFFVQLQISIHNQLLFLSLPSTLQAFSFVRIPSQLT